MTTPDQDPVSIDHVVLTVHDLDKVGDYYRRVVGLHDLRRDDGTLTLGAGGRTLLELRRDAAAREFYLHNGDFLASPVEEFHLMVPMKAILKYLD